MREMKEPKKPTSDARISEIEKELGISLPLQYRNFLLRYNGGHPIPDGFVFKEAPYGDSCVAWFLAIDSELSNFVETFECMRDRMPRELIPIADDPGGNQICIAVAGPNTGAVYFWDHEHEVDEGDVPTYQNISLIANSFDEFIDSLHDY